MLKVHVLVLPVNLSVSLRNDFPPLRIYLLTQ